MVEGSNPLQDGWNFIKKLHPLVYMLIALYIFVPMLSSRFLMLQNQMNITRQVAIYLIVSIGMTFVITSKGIDLSVGSTLAMIACVIATGLKNETVPPFLSFPFVLIMGAILGMMVGLVITKLKVPAFIASIGMLVTYRGLTHLYMGGKVIVRLPETIVYIGQGSIGPIPVPALISFAITLLGWWIFRFTRFGRYTVAIGSNESACRVVGGIKVDFYKILIYAFQGALVGIGALIMIGRLNGTSAVLAEGYEMHVIAAVVMGGTSLHGGRSSILGTVLGVYTIGVIENAMVLVGADFHTQRVIIGLLLISSIAFQGYRERKMGVLEKE